MDTRQIRRLSYDGDYERAITMLCDIIDKQDKLITKLISDTTSTSKEVLK